MTDYTKKTVAELTEILKSRSLPHTGKKADLVARLTESDKSSDNPAAAPAPAAQSQEKPVSQPQQQAPPDVAAIVTPSTAAPEEPPAQTQPTTTSQAPADAAPSPDTVLTTTANYTLNLASSSIDDEMAKRKARAERFGTGNPTAAANGEATTTEPVNTATADNADTEALRALERAKRFGTGSTAMGKLDEALPAEREKRKRGRDAIEGTDTGGSGAMDDPGLKAGRGGKRTRGGGRGGGREGGNGKGDRPVGVMKNKPKNKNGRDGSRAGSAPAPAPASAPAFSSEKDRLAAEARKKKFGAA